MTRRRLNIDPEMDFSIEAVKKRAHKHAMLVQSEAWEDAAVLDAAVLEAASKLTFPAYDGGPIKTCPSCRCNYPATTKHYYRNKKAAHGLASWCKSCIKAKSNSRYSVMKGAEKTNSKKSRPPSTPLFPEEIEALEKDGIIPAGYKKCPLCSMVKEKEVHFRRLRKNVYDGKWKSYCIPCSKAYKKVTYRRNVRKKQNSADFIPTYDVSPAEAREIY